MAALELGEASGLFTILRKTSSSSTTVTDADCLGSSSHVNGTVVNSHLFKVPQPPPSCQMDTPRKLIECTIRTKGMTSVNQNILKFFKLAIDKINSMVEVDEDSVLNCYAEVTERLLTVGDKIMLNNSSMLNDTRRTETSNFFKPIENGNNQRWNINSSNVSAYPDHNNRIVNSYFKQQMPIQSNSYLLPIPEENTTSGFFVTNGGYTERTLAKSTCTQDGFDHKDQNHREDNSLSRERSTVNDTLNGTIYHSPDLSISYRRVFKHPHKLKNNSINKSSFKKSIEFNDMSRELKNWYIRRERNASSSRDRFHLIGSMRLLNGEWTNDVLAGTVESRKSSYIVKTNKGIFMLRGQMRCDVRGISSKIKKHFVNGFPICWRKVLSEE